MDDLVNIATQALFGVLFLWAVWKAVRDHDALARDVALVFMPIAILLATGVIREVGGPLPYWASAATIILLLAQPVFSLKLVSDIRVLPRWVLQVAAGAFIITSGLLVLTGGLDPLANLAAIGAFIITELVAAGYFAVEARRRSAAARTRLAVAAVATAAVALAIFAVALAAASPAAASGIANVAIHVGALLAAVGYWIAFLPPAPFASCGTRVPHPRIRSDS